MKTKKNYFCWCWKSIFLSWNFETIFKKVPNFKMDWNLHQQVASATMRFQASVFFSGDINHLNQWYLFGHVARGSPKDDRLRALLSAMRHPETVRWRLKERHRRMNSGPGALRTILCHWIIASTRMWRRHKTALFGDILQSWTHSSVEFTNDDDDDDDDDDIYDSDHRFK